MPGRDRHQGHAPVEPMPNRQASTHNCMQPRAAWIRQEVSSLIDLLSPSLQRSGRSDPVVESLARFPTAAFGHGTCVACDFLTPFCALTRHGAATLLPGCSSHTCPGRQQTPAPPLTPWQLAPRCPARPALRERERSNCRTFCTLKTTAHFHHWSVVRDVMELRRSFCVDSDQTVFR